MQEKKRVLIIEDEAALTNILSEQLTASGYEVLKSSDGKMGYDLAVNRMPHLILLDVSLPEMSGIDVLRKLRADSSTKGIEVVLLTNSADSTHLAEALMLEAHDYLVKSDWQMSDIIKLIETKIGK
jgi:DNA-binding response OmpR family regulator